MDIPDGMTYEVRADPAPLDDPEDASDLPGTPTAAELRSINARMAMAPLTREQVFAFPFVISNNQVDSYWTWMHETTLRNYVRQAQTDRGVPFMTNHVVKANTTGRIFAGELVREQPAEAAKKDDPGGADRAPAIPHARDAFNRAGDPMTVIQKAYMLRGVEVNGQPNDGLIANIVGGVQASYSVGLAAYGPQEPGSALICDICGSDQYRASFEDCPHFPGLSYEMAVGDSEDKQAVLATSHWLNARQREASSVYLGATPGTFTQRAQGLYAARMMSERDARLLEDRMHLTRGLIVGESPRTISIPKAPAPAARPHITREDEMDRQRVIALYGSTPDRVAELQMFGLDADPAKALNSAWAERLAEAEARATKAAAERAAFEEQLAERLALAEGEDLATGVARITAEAALGQQLRGMAVEELLRQMVRGGLIENSKQAEVQRSLVKGWDLKQIMGQVDMYRKQADDRLRNPATGGAGGRVSTPPEPREQEPPADRAQGRRFAPVLNRV